MHTTDPGGSQTIAKRAVLLGTVLIIANSYWDSLCGDDLAHRAPDNSRDVCQCHVRHFGDNAVEHGCPTYLSTPRLAAARPPHRLQHARCRKRVFRTRLYPTPDGAYSLRLPLRYTRKRLGSTPLSPSPRMACRETPQNCYRLLRRRGELLYGRLCAVLDCSDPLLVRGDLPLDAHLSMLDRAPSQTVDRK